MCSIEYTEHTDVNAIISKINKSEWECLYEDEKYKCPISYKILKEPV